MQVLFISLLLVLLVQTFISAVAVVPNRCAHMSMDTLDYIRDHSTVDVKNRWLNLNEDCYIRNVTVTQGRKCLSNVKIAFFGDSISRDLGHAMVEFLNGRDFGRMQVNQKYDKKFTFAQFEHMCICRDFSVPVSGLESFRRCKLNESCAHGTRHFATKAGQAWEVTVYTEGSYGGKHSFPNLYNVQRMKQYDLMILGNTGLHGINKNIPAYPYVFFHPLLQFTNPIAEGGMKPRARKSATELPFVYLFPNKHHDELKHHQHKLRRQSHLVDYVNAMGHDFSAEHNMPYFDTAIVSKYKETSADGLHIWQWANLIEVKMLLHFFCDENWTFKRVAYHLSSSG